MTLLSKEDYKKIVQETLPQIEEELLKYSDINEGDELEVNEVLYKTSKPKEEIEFSLLIKKDNKNIGEVILALVIDVEQQKLLDWNISDVTYKKYR